MKNTRLKSKLNFGLCITLAFVLCFNVAVFGVRDTSLTADSTHGWREAFADKLNHYQGIGIERLTFFLHDISGNGIPEVIILCNSADRTLAIYTFINGSAVPLEGDWRYPILFAFLGFRRHAVFTPENNTPGLLIHGGIRDGNEWDYSFTLLQIQQNGYVSTLFGIIQPDVDGIVAYLRNIMGATDEQIQLFHRNLFIAPPHVLEKSMWSIDGTPVSQEEFEAVFGSSLGERVIEFDWANDSRHTLTSDNIYNVLWEWQVNPQPSTQPQGLQPWQVAYADYVRRLVPDSFTTFFLHDINNSGIPELIVLQSDGYYNELSRIYTFTNNQMVEVEIIIRDGLRGFGMPLFAVGGIRGGFHWPAEGTYGLIRFEGAHEQLDFARYILVGNQLVTDTSTTGQRVCSTFGYDSCDASDGFDIWLVNGREVSQAEFSILFNGPSVQMFHLRPDQIEELIQDAIFNWTGERPSHWQELYQGTLSPLAWNHGAFSDDRESQWQFGLHDINNNGIPELIVMGSQGYASHLFSVRYSHAMPIQFEPGVSLNEIPAGSGTAFKKPHDNRPGLIRTIGNLQFQTLYFHVLEGDQLVLQTTGTIHRHYGDGWEHLGTDFTINGQPATQQAFYRIFGADELDPARNIAMHPLTFDAWWTDTERIFANWRPIATATPSTPAAQTNRPSTPIAVRLNGQYIQFDTPPVNMDGRILVPLRAIFEALGAYPQWDGATQTVTATRGDVTVTLQIGNHTLTRNGQPIALDVPPRIIDSRTLVPTRAIAEAFGVDVSWDGDAQTVVLEGN